jgi:hypothetical protein
MAKRRRRSENENCLHKKRERKKHLGGGWNESPSQLGELLFFLIFLIFLVTTRLVISLLCPPHTYIIYNSL